MNRQTKIINTLSVENRTYAGVLGKLIGVYLGRAVEGWFYEDIEREFDEVNYYVNDKVGHPLIVPDDDISGTFLFFRALEDNGFPKDISAKTIGDTWLNYIVEDKTVLWWGGLGRSTEHTAYLRLKNGIDAPASGSSRLNGTGMSEQIGAEIFIDTWAMVNPGDPDRATAMARRAGSVSHDGVAVEAACLLAAMQAAAYDESNIDKLLDLGLGFTDNENLRRVVGDVREQCEIHSKDWRKVRKWLEKNHSYGHYPGNCPMVPNHALLLSAFILGGDDFQKGLKIAVSAGWDTDCNAGNLGALNGIRLGLDGLEAGADFRKPVAERMYVVGSDGGECVTDAVIETRRILRAAAALKDEEYIPPKARFSFEFPGSVQGFQACPLHDGIQAIKSIGNGNVIGTQNGLLVEFDSLAPGAEASVSVPTFIDPMPTGRSGTSYFEVIASPSLYGTQTVRAHIECRDLMNPEVRPYIYYFDETENLKMSPGDWSQLNSGENSIIWEVPNTGGRPVHRFGFEFRSASRLNGSVCITDVDWSGAPKNLEFGLSRSITPGLTPWDYATFWSRSFVSSAKHFATDIYHTFALSHPDDNGVITTGGRDWVDYNVSSTLIMELHKAVGLVARTRGHRRYYAAVLQDGKAQIIRKFDKDVSVLASVPYSFVPEAPLNVEFRVNGDILEFWIEGKRIITAASNTFASGGAGFLIEEGCVPARGFSVKQSV